MAETRITGPVNNPGRASRREAKAWAKVAGDGTGIDGTAYNVASIDDDSAGLIGVNLTTAMSSVNYVAGATCFSTTDHHFCRLNAQAAGSFDVLAEIITTNTDPSDSYQVWAFGDSA